MGYYFSPISLLQTACLEVGYDNFPGIFPIPPTTRQYSDAVPGSPKILVRTLAQPWDRLDFGMGFWACPK